MLYVQDIDLTPNPQALKFVLNENLLNRETRSFSSKEEAESDPLAKGIYEIEGIVSVFYMDKFVTIEKEPEKNWGEIQRTFVEFIKSFDKSLIPPEEELETYSPGEDTDILNKITEIIDTRVRPALAGDGGGLDIIDYKENTLTIRYMGACGTCPSAIRGTLVAIENLLRRE